MKKRRDEKEKSLQGDNPIKEIQSYRKQKSP